VTAPRMSVLDPAGPQAAQIASLWSVFLWVSVIVWAIVAIALVAAALHKRAVSDRVLVRAVIIASSLTVVTLFALLVTSVTTGDALAALEDDADALHVKITGRQWWWDIQYSPDDPRTTASTANELHVPVGKIVHLELVSSDVIHSFWVPSVHGKRDLIPGRQNRTWIRVDQPGVYRGQCAEFCGLEHAKMAITVIAEPAADFDRWLAHQREPGAAPETADQLRGKEVFLGGPCVVCHAIGGTSAGGRLGPDLTHFASRQTIGAGALPNTAGHLAGWIANAQTQKPGARMPAILLPPDDLLALTAYLEHLR
jgi:cytochrome c oxidase subunit II